MLVKEKRIQPYSLTILLFRIFYNGKFVTQHILNEKYFDRFITTQ
ncbi:YoaP domain-containing protein [uncultured Aquimarina sp.]